VELFPYLLAGNQIDYVLVVANGIEGPYPCRTTCSVLVVQQPKHWSGMLCAIRECRRVMVAGDAVYTPPP
jgi:hypothetical protein